MRCDWAGALVCGGLGGSVMSVRRRQRPAAALLWSVAAAEYDVLPAMQGRLFSRTVGAHIKSREIRTCDVQEMCEMRWRMMSSRGQTVPVLCSCR